MASRKPKEDRVEEVGKPDFDKVANIILSEIKPLAAEQAVISQKMSTSYKEIDKHAHVQRQAARTAFGVLRMEESKRDDWLRGFNGVLKALNIFMPVDMVDQAEGKGSVGETVVPTGQRRAPKLATIQGGRGAPAGDTDLAGGDLEPSGVDKAKAAAAGEPWADGTVKGAAPAADDAAGDIAEDTFGIINERTGKWLKPGVGDDDDQWVATPAEGGTWAHADAVSLIGEFDEGDTLVARRIVG